MIKAVFIDIDDTLLDFSACAEHAIRSGFSDFSIPFSEEAVFPAFYRINDALWYEIEQQRLTKSELHKIRWNRIFSALGIEEDGCRFEECFLSYLRETAIPMEGAKELLSYLSEKYVLCAASNSAYEQQDGRLRRAGMRDYFYKLFISEQIGHAKPDKGFFDACFLELDGICREETVMIGDSLSADIAGGAAYGLMTVYFNRKGETLPENCPADHVVSALSEIKGIL